MTTPMPADEAERIQKQRGTTAVPPVPFPPDAPLLAVTAPSEFDLGLIVVSLEATMLDAPPDPRGGPDAKARKVPAYDIALRTVVPEGFAPAVRAAARDHRLTVRVTAPAPEGVGR